MAEWKNRIVGTDIKPASSFLANPANWRIHPQNQQSALLGSLSEVGWIQDVIVNLRADPSWGSDRGVETLIDGHLRVSLALREGDETPIPMKYVDLLPSEENLILASMDPIAALAVADKEKLDSLLRETKPADAALQQFLSELAAREGLYTGNGTPVLENVEPQVDRADELQKVWSTQLGQLWEIPSLNVPGESHRLLCGDSVSRENVSHLMAGEQPSLIVTDPPYGQEYLSNWYGPHHSAPNPQGKLLNDDLPHPEMLSEWIDTLHPAGALYVCTRWVQCEEWSSWIDSRLKIRNIIVWKKNNWSAGNLEGAYGFMYEQVIFACREGHKLRGYRLPDVWEFDRVPPDLHPTTKPIGLFGQAIEKSSDIGSLVADPFCGSGTAIVSSEQLGRLCYACDIEPKYIAVTLQRLQDSGLTPKLVES